MDARNLIWVAVALLFIATGCGSSEDDATTQRKEQNSQVNHHNEADLIGAALMQLYLEQRGDDAFVIAGQKQGSCSGGGTVSLTDQVKDTDSMGVASGVFAIFIMQDCRIVVNNSEVTLDGIADISMKDLGSNTQSDVTVRSRRLAAAGVDGNGMRFDRSGCQLDSIVKPTADDITGMWCGEVITNPYN